LLILPSNRPRRPPPGPSLTICVFGGTSADQIVAAADTPVLQRIAVEKAVIDAMRERLHLGTLFVTTDLPAHSDTRSGKDFVIMGVEEG